MKDDELRIIISQNLRRYREEAGLSQEELGSHFGKAKTSVASWEQNAKSLPDAALLYHIAEFYNKPIEDFFKRRE